MKFLSVICTIATVLFPLKLAAQPVALKAKVGEVSIKGKLVDFDGELYRVETDLGIMTIDARTVDCVGKGCPKAQDMITNFSITGSGNLGDILVPGLIEAFTASLGGEVISEIESNKAQTLKVKGFDGKSIAEIKVAVQPAYVIFSEMAQRKDLIAAVSRKPTTTEALAYGNAGGGQVLATDAIIATVSSFNPLDTISITNLRKVLQGKITNWRDIGGPDATIDLYLPKNDTAFVLALAESILALKPSQISPAATRFNSLADVSDAVAGNPFGIGLTSFSNRRNTAALGLKGNCNIYSIPSAFTLKSGGYPLKLTHYFYRPSEKMPLFAREFLEFAKSDQAQNVIRSYGYADLAISTRSINHQGLRLTNAIVQMGKGESGASLQKMAQMQNGAKRLSTTFRFQKDGHTLDAQSLQNADQLASALLLGNFADKQVHVIGFTNSAGKPKQELLRAEALAKSALLAIINAAPNDSLEDVEFHVSGFGGASPLACDDTEAGKKINQRVEIWVKAIDSKKAAN